MVQEDSESEIYNFETAGYMLFWAHNASCNDPHEILPSRKDTNVNDRKIFGCLKFLRNVSQNIHSHP